MRAEDKIYKAFFDLREKQLYYNQIKEHTKLSHSSLQNALKNILKKDVLREEKTKAHVFYIINNKKFIAIKFCEFAITKQEQLNYNITTPLQHFIKNVPEEVFTIILFGSTARGEETKRSDIDLLVVSHNKQDLKKNQERAQLTAKHTLSVFQATINDFKNNNDDIIIQAKKTGFPIHKEQNYYETILDEY